MQDFRLDETRSQVGPTANAYQAPVLDPTQALFAEDDVVVELASPWVRMGARILDFLPLALIGIVAAIVAPFFAGPAEQSGGMVVLLMLLAMLVFTGYQIWLMTRYGQSLGKRLLGIRVIKEDGSNPGFVRYVLLREFAFNLILQFIGLIPLLGPLVVLVVWVACVVMLFLEDRDHRTLQDMLANTLVVKV